LRRSWRFMGIEMEADAVRPTNKLLRSLRPEAYARIEPKLSRKTLRAQEVLYRPNQPISEVYFPENAVICQMTVMANGDTLETGTVGSEGASWISASIGAPSMPCETIVAIGGDAMVLAIDDLDHEMQQNEHFRDVLTQYSHALLIHSMRMTGCTGLHSLEQRCARWVLTTLDRVVENRFSVTHEFLAMLLGASRPSVSLVIEDFEKRGMLRRERGRVLVGDRERLLSVTCDCYQVIKDNYEQVGRTSRVPIRTPVPSQDASQRAR
jgi:CRP-like cAMP-binding protein